jgi:hypothetical protein
MISHYIRFFSSRSLAYSIPSITDTANNLRHTQRSLTNSANDAGRSRNNRDTLQDIARSLDDGELDRFSDLGRGSRVGRSELRGDGGALDGWGGKSAGSHGGDESDGETHFGVGRWD